MPKEIEIKFRIENLRALARALKQAGFKQLTRSTHEMNSLYDLPGQKLPQCPAGGHYTINAIGQPPTCSEPGHVLAE